MEENTAEVIPEPEAQPTLNEVADEVVAAEEATETPTGGAETSGEQETAPVEPAGEVVEPSEEQRGVEKKIAKLTRKRRDAERDAEYWRQQAQGNQPAAPTPEPEGPPEPEGFEDYDQYIRATARYEAKQEFVAEQKQSTQRKQEATHRNKVDGIVNEGKTKYDDFEELTSAIPLSDYTMVAITETENGQDVAYYLGKNPTEAEAIFRMPPFQQAREIYKIETKLNSAPPPKPSGAPPPIDPITTAGKGDVKYSADMTDEEYANWRAGHKK